MNVIQWLWWFFQGKRIGLYCSDVSGAFDKVRSDRLVEKLEHLGVRGKLLTLLTSWLENRDAVVTVDGFCSEKAVLCNMVYQGTVLGPPLWNVYFADARLSVLRSGFKDTLFADDLNCYKAFPAKTSNKLVHADLRHCQTQLHSWGGADQVQFDSGKETFHVLDRWQPDGESFTARSHLGPAA